MHNRPVMQTYKDDRLFSLQRESLENMENKLQADAGNFLGRVRAGNTSRGPSTHRDVSTTRY